MMGEVPAPPPEPAPGIPDWAAFVPPRWWPVAASAVAVALVGIYFARRPRVAPPRPAPSVIAKTSPPSRIPGPVAPPKPPPAPVAAPARAPEPEAPPPPRKIATAASPYGKTFDRAQKALWTNDAKQAEALLGDLLKRRGLSRRDRARASKMMGDAETKAGKKSNAARWYRKSFNLYDDPQERAKVARLLGSK